MAKRRKKGKGLWVMVLLVLAVLAVLVFLAGGSEGIGGRVREEISLVVDRVDELISAVKNRKGPQAPVKPAIEPPTPEELKPEREPAVEPDKPPLSKPVSERDRAKLEDILEDGVYQR